MRHILNLLAILILAPAANASRFYVSSYTGNRIYEVSSTGVASVAIPAGNALSAPEGMAYDSFGNLFIANQDIVAIGKWPVGGSYSYFVGLGSFTGGLGGLAIDSANNMYISTQSGNSILKVTPNKATTVFASGLSQPQGLAFDQSGNLYAANRLGNSVLKITPSGNVTTFASNITGATGVTFDSDENLYVSSNVTGTITKILSGGGQSTFATGIPSAWGMDFGDDGHLYVCSGASSPSGAIYKVSPAGVATPFVTGLAEPLYIVAAIPEPSSLSLIIVCGWGIFHRPRRHSHLA
jgi:hypothetical protein